jgi:uncharacterized phage protein (TIGR01671 family)
MRKILFRGKQKKGGWVYGNYDPGSNPDEFSWIKTPIKGSWKLYRVIPETVGQFSGILDKNEVMIFDGDIVSFWNGTVYEAVDGDITYENVTGIIFKRTPNKKSIVVFEDGCFRLKNNNPLNSFFGEESLEIIGNLFDTPELLDRK